MLDKNHGTLGYQTARECICVLRTNRTREAEGDFWGLTMRRDKGRVVDPPLVFKRVFRRREESPGWRELEESPGWRELEESPGWRELEESPEKKRRGRLRIEIGVERKERPRTLVALENWNEWF
ncbi:hypothetical protein TNCV_1533941 [Trichonephila clavipes]|nr:hypothetical protein TNCV_1533941 [Trichonephila clavipes]